MAKQKETKKFEFSKVGSILDNIAKSVPVQIEKEIKEKTFITTGVYLLDAALSGRLLGGGVANNRITAFAGEFCQCQPENQIEIASSQPG